MRLLPSRNENHSEESSDIYYYSFATIRLKKGLIEKFPKNDF